MRSASHEHELAHAIGEVRRMALGDVADFARNLCARQQAKRLSADVDGSPMRLEEAEHGAEKRGLAAAVRPEHAQGFAAGEREAHVAADRAAGKTESEVVDFEHHQLRRASAKSHKKNGVPMSAVSTPG